MVIQRTSPRYAALSQARPVRLRELQKLLDPDTLLLEYALGRQRSFLWAVSADSVHSFKLAPRATLEEESRTALSLLAASDGADVRRLTGEPALAEDITQEVFTAVWTRAATFRPDRGSATCWLYTLTRNKFVDHWRGDAGLETLDEPRLPASGTAGGELRVTLRQALARIAPEQRRAIEMAYFGGLTYEETADRLSLPVGTLKSRIRLGLRTMRTVLAPLAL